MHTNDITTYRERNPCGNLAEGEVMRFQRLDLNLLVALDALLDEKSVSAAADRICLSQSATSSALGRLREYFGDELLVQKGRKMVLTARGEELVEPVRNVLHQIQTTIAIAPEFDPSETDRTLTIMASDYATQVLFCRAFQEIAVEAPGLRFVIRPMGEHVLALDRGEIDLLVTIDMAIRSEHPSEPMFEDTYVIMGWDQNPHIAGGIDKKTYFELGHVMTGFVGNRQPAFEEWFLRSQSLERRVEVTAPSFLSVPFLLVGTHRIATVHNRLARRLARQLPLKILPVPFDIPPLRQSAQWHRSNSADPCLSWVVAKLKESARWEGVEIAQDSELDEARQKEAVTRQVHATGAPDLRRIDSSDP